MTIAHSLHPDTDIGNAPTRPEPPPRNTDLTNAIFARFKTDRPNREATAALQCMARFPESQAMLTQIMRLRVQHDGQPMRLEAIAAEIFPEDTTRRDLLIRRAKLVTSIRNAHEDSTKHQKRQMLDIISVEALKCPLDESFIENFQAWFTLVNTGKIKTMDDFQSAQWPDWLSDLPK